MNSNIQKLYTIAGQPSRILVGLMSGTSLDGLDIALCRVEGADSHTRIELMAFESVPYSEGFRNEIKTVFSRENVSTRQLSAMNARIGMVHADMVLSALKNWEIDPAQVDGIASHGQTVFHAPQCGDGLPNSTLQIGDGDHIAVRTGIITLSDFRQKHVAAGGEGAPLVIYGDYLLFGDMVEDRILLNIGGISNYTVLPAGKTSQGVIATDVGPGNTLMNQYVQLHYGMAYDADGRIASAGKVNQDLLDSLMGHGFFREAFPKTTGPELFSMEYLLDAQQRSGTDEISPEDVMASLAEFTVRTIAESVLKMQDAYPNLHVYLSGGGYSNPLLRESLRSALGGIPLDSTAALGMNPDAKEAMLFALLANQTLAGNPTAFDGISGAPAVRFGKLSFPD